MRFIVFILFGFLIFNIEAAAAESSEVVKPDVEKSGAEESQTPKLNSKFCRGYQDVIRTKVIYDYDDSNRLYPFYIEDVGAYKDLKRDEFSAQELRALDLYNKSFPMSQEDELVLIVDEIFIGYTKHQKGYEVTYGPDEDHLLYLKNTPKDFFKGINDVGKEKQTTGKPILPHGTRMALSYTVLPLRSFQQPSINHEEVYLSAFGKIKRGEEGYVGTEVLEKLRYVKMYFYTDSTFHSFPNHLNQFDDDKKKLEYLQSYHTKALFQDVYSDADSKYEPLCEAPD